MESWWAFACAALAAAFICVVPGLLACLAARTRPLTATLASVPVTMTIIAVSAHGAAMMGIRWGVLPVLITTAVLCLLFLPLRLLRPQPRHHESWRSERFFTWKTMLWASGAAALIHAVRLLVAWKTPIAISQTYDAPFHLNLIAAMAHSGDASFLHVNIAALESPRGFYPAVFHEICALLVKVGGLPIPMVVNAVTFVVTALVWPITMGCAVACMTRSWRYGSAASLVSFALSQMPTQLVWFGVLYPNLLGYALVPAMLALVWLALWGGDGRKAHAWVLGIVSIPGLAIAHTSALITFVVLAFPLLLFGIPEAFARHVRDTRRLLRAGVALIGGVLVVAAYLVVNRLSMMVSTIRLLRAEEAGWNPLGGPLGGIARALSLTAGTESYRGINGLPYLLGVIILVGMIAALRKLSTAPIALAHALAIVLYVVAWAMKYPERSYYIGVWYCDIVRISSILGITGIPMLAIGSMRIADGISAVMGRLRQGQRTYQRAVSIAMMLVITLAGQLSSMVGQAYQTIDDVFSFDTDDPRFLGLLSRDEYRLLTRLDRTVPEGDVVIGNPWNGSVFAPALSHRRVVFPHVALSSDRDGMLVAEQLGNPASHDAVCSVVKERRIYYLLDFGDDYLWGGDPNGKHRQFPALTGVKDTSVAQIVDREGDAKLLKITECDE